ncbi:hypothetical protein [Paenibacillus sp. PL2-23]|uniref:hypothetical protein n=1 Tax=Paenibacillus sp. PL2-23 TaxID=2100729 RepID=UPI0030F7BC4B
MRVGYSILREIHWKENMPESRHYGLKDFEFERMIKLLEREGYLERVLRAGDKFSLRPAKLTRKGEVFLEENKDLEDTYPIDKKELITWIQVDKLKYSNDASEE